MSTRKSFAMLACALVAWLLIVPSAQAQVRFEELPPDMLIDTADSASGWTSGNTLSVDTQIKVNGAASLKSTGTSPDRFRRRFTAPLDISKYRFLTFWYYVDRPDRLGAAGGDMGQIEISSSGTFDNQEQNWNVRLQYLQRGWNYVVLDLPGRARGDVPFDPVRMNYLRIYHIPTGSITTRIDHVMFTSRPPKSFAYAQYLDQKRISVSPAAVDQYDVIFDFLQGTVPGSSQRAIHCRRLQIDLTHRDINGYTLKDLGVPASFVDAEIAERRLVKEYVCGERTYTRAQLLTRLQQRAATEVAVAGQIATLFDVSVEAAAETKLRLLDLDLNRILGACQSTREKIDDFVQTGRRPTLMPGVNVLVELCQGTHAQVAQLLKTVGGLPNISNRGTQLKQCLASFQSQGSECSSPLASQADDDFKAEVNRIQGMTEAGKRDVIANMGQIIEVINNVTLQEARAWTGKATHADPAHPEAQALERLHEQHDQNRGKLFRAWSEKVPIQMDQDPSVGPVGETPEAARVRMAAATAALKRIWAEEEKLFDERRRIEQQICAKDEDDPLCPPPNAQNQPQQPANPPVSTARCADMKFKDGSNAWFNNSAGTGAVSRQLDQGDRINHCLCEMHDTTYRSLEPNAQQFGLAGCPTAEERTSQKCLENPFDGDDGVRPECRHLMQPISVDRDTLGAKMCEKVLPNCAVPYPRNDGSCGCGTTTPNPGEVRLPNCSKVIRCPADSMPSGDCGCQPFNSGATICTPGGKDFYLTRDPGFDLKIRRFPEKAGFANLNVMVAKTGGVRFVTPAFTRNQLRNANTLAVRAVLPGASYDGTGQIRVTCTNPSVGTRNRLIETIPLAGMSTSNPNLLNITLDANDRAACYGTNANSNAYLEFFVDSKTNQPVGFLDILDDIGNIKPPCIGLPSRPGPGPRPLNAWPSAWTMSDGFVLAPLFNGTGQIPVSADDPPTLPPLCMRDGVVVPCP